MLVNFLIDFVGFLVDGPTRTFGLVNIFAIRFFLFYNGELNEVYGRNLHHLF